MYYHRLSKKIRIDLINGMLANHENRQVLDIGCGAGFISKIYNAVGVDVKADELKWASKQFGNCKFVVGQAEKLPFKNQTFDTVLCVEVVEHLDDGKLLYTEIDRVIGSDGVLIISTPSLDGILKPPKMLGHIKRGFTLAEIEKELSPHGFRVLDVKYYNKIFSYGMWVLFHHLLFLDGVSPTLKFILTTIQFSPLFPLLYVIYRADLCLPVKGAGMVIKAQKEK
ncbi:MAG: class I SAM-dependent methyltransferase [Methanocellales archaeon]|nr:class I SAM-dependent methyltransferase [Methanocellales archaeon]